MSTRIALAAALAITAAASQAHAVERGSNANRFYLPPVVGMTYSDPRIATNSDEVRKQGGFATPSAVRWLPAAPAADNQVANRFYLPPVVGMTYSDPRIATNSDEVRKQGGFATAGAVRWLPAAPATDHDKIAELILQRTMN